MILSVMPVVGLMLLFLLPRFVASLNERLAKQRQNMLVLRGLLLCLAVGGIIMTAAGNMVILTLGKLQVVLVPMNVLANEQRLGDLRWWQRCSRTAPCS